jgi:hypothetical protein
VCVPDSSVVGPIDYGCWCHRGATDVLGRSVVWALVSSKTNSDGRRLKTRAGHFCPALIAAHHLVAHRRALPPPPFSQAHHPAIALPAGASRHCGLDKVGQMRRRLSKTRPGIRSDPGRDLRDSRPCYFHCKLRRKCFLFSWPEAQRPAVLTHVRSSHGRFLRDANTGLDHPNSATAGGRRVYHI